MTARLIQSEIYPPDMAILDVYFQHWVINSADRINWHEETNIMCAKLAYHQAFQAGFYEAVRQFNTKKLQK